MNDHHDNIEALLPWHVNGTLSLEEGEATQGHVANCVTCRGQLNLLGEVAWVVEQAVAPHFDTDLALARARKALHLDRKARKRRGLATLALSSRAIRWVLVAQAAALAVAATLLISQRLHVPSSPDEFHGLSTPARSVSTSRPRVRILFSEGATEGQIRTMLHEIGGRIVDGPTAIGLYTIELQQSASAPELLEPLVDALRRRPGIRFAELEVTP